MAATVMHPDPLIATAISFEKRFDSVNQFIVKLQKHGLETWYQDIIGCILLRCRTNFGHLMKAYQRPFDTECLAWATRNLLELAVWAKFATASKANAQRLHDDHLVDLSELQRNILSLGTAHNAKPRDLNTLRCHGQWIDLMKDELGLDPQGKHLNIGSVAKEVGAADVFYSFNGMLSKFVHPTAFSLLLTLDEAMEKELRTMFCAVGQGFTQDTLSALIGFFDGIGLDTELLKP